MASHVRVVSGRFTLALLPAVLLGGCHRAQVIFLVKPTTSFTAILPREAATGRTLTTAASPVKRAYLAPLRRRSVVARRVERKTSVIRPFTTTQMAAPLPSTQPTPAQSEPAPGEAGIAFRAGLLAILGGLLVGLGGVLLGVGLGGAWVLLTGTAGLAVGVLMGMAGLFGALSHDTSTGSRFHVVRLLGLAVGLGGLALGWHLGGLVGVATALLLLGAGSFLTGLGLAIGAEPRPGPPVSK